MVGGWGGGGGRTMDMVCAGVLYHVEVEDPGAKVLVRARDLCSVEGGQEPTVSSPQPDDGNLMCAGHGCDVVILSVGCIQYEAQYITNTDQTSSVPVVANGLRCAGATGGGGSDDDEEEQVDVKVILTPSIVR